jgi:hypothetical protein
MAMVAVPQQASAQYTTQYRVLRAVPEQQPTQQTHLVEIQNQEHQHQQHVIVQQAQSPYQNAPEHTQPNVQTRIINVSPRSKQQTSPTPTRRFVTFKNLRYMNKPGQQWEHCEHITISLSPEEIERKIRCHDLPGNDLTRCLTSMGVYRQRHVRRYEDKLNNREFDRSSWSWVLKALGELRERPKSTPHTFWAIFQRTAKQDGSNQESHADPNVTVHRIFEAVPVAQISAPPPATVAALPAPLQIQTLPAPPVVHQQQHQQHQISAPKYEQTATVTQPARSTSSRQTSNLNVSSPQYQVTFPVQQTAATYSTQKTYEQRKPQDIQQSNTPSAPQAAQRAVVRQIAQGTTTQIAPAKKQYTRPIPRPIERPNSPPLTYKTASDIDVYQSLRQGGMPSRVWTQSHSDRERYEDDSMSDTSTSSCGSSSYNKAANCGRRQAPLGWPQTMRNASTHVRQHQSDDEMHNNTSNSHRQSHHNESVDPRRPERQRNYPTGPHSRHITRTPERNFIPISSAGATTNPPKRPQMKRQNTYDIEVNIGPTPSAPDTYSTLLRRSNADNSNTPRSYARREELDYEYDSEDMEEQSGRIRKSYSARSKRSQQVPGTFGNGYYTAGLVSYGNDTRERMRDL